MGGPRYSVRLRTHCVEALSIKDRRRTGARLRCELEMDLTVARRAFETRVPPDLARETAGSPLLGQLVGSEAFQPDLGS